MKKRDLEYGNVVETREGIKYLYHCMNSDKFLNLDDDGFLWICDFDKNLKHIYDLYEFDIMKVYKDYTCKELLWERKETPKLTEDEKAILRNLPKEYKWIARDKTSDIYLYEYKPKKYIFGWVCNSVWTCHAGWTTLAFPHLFQFIKWEDDEPYSIEELLGE